MGKQTKNNKNEHGERGLLRQQMELLAVRSENCNDEELSALTMAMVEIYKTLYWQPVSARNFLESPFERR